MLARINAKLLLNKKSPLNIKLIINAISFQVVWFICVQGNNLNAALATIVMLSLQQLIFKINLKVWPLLIAFSLLGYLGDSVIARLLLIEYSDNLNPLAPLWLLSLWLSFATTLNHSMKWLFKTPYLTICLALFIVPLSYLAGINLSDSTLSGSYTLFYLSEGVWWAMLLVGYQRLIEFSGVKHD
ncbi:MAG: hypothetical protein ACI9N9_002499 [Enterobacterales bacterium]|jgi:hypothetical protein